MRQESRPSTHTRQDPWWKSYLYRRKDQRPYDWEGFAWPAQDWCRWKSFNWESGIAGSQTIEPRTGWSAFPVSGVALPSQPEHRGDSTEIELGFDHEEEYLDADQDHRPFFKRVTITEVESQLRQTNHTKKIVQYLTRWYMQGLKELDS